MKKLLFYLMWMSPAIGLGQDTVWSRWGTYTAKPIRPHVTYYPVYGGKQLVEVDFFSFYNDLTRYENAVWEEKYGHSHLGGREMPNSPNMFIFRDVKGGILGEFYPKSECNQYLKPSDLLPVSQAPITYYKAVLDSVEANRDTYGRFPNRPKMRQPYFQFRHLNFVGVADTLGNIIVPPYSYTWIGSDDQYPMVRGRSGKYGILGPDWVALQEPTFSELSPMATPGVFVGCLDEKCGIFTVNAELLVPFEYVWEPKVHWIFDKPCPLYCVPVRNEKGWGFISPDGPGLDWGYDEVKAHSFGYMVRKQDNWAWFDCYGKRLTEFAYADLEPERIEGSYFKLVFAGGDPDDYYSREYQLVNKSGEIMVPGRFKAIYSLGMGEFGGWADDRLTIMDTTDWQIRDFPIHQYVFDMGVLLGTSEGNGYKVIDRQGNTVIPGPFMKLEKFGTSFILSEQSDGNFQLWKSNGELLIPGQYQRIAWDEAGWIWANQSQGNILVDTMGNRVPGLNSGILHSPVHLGTVIVSQVIELTFEESEELGTSFRTVFGVMDLKGNWVVPCKYPKHTYPDTFSPHETIYSVGDSLETWVQQADGSWKRFDR